MKGMMDPAWGSAWVNGYQGWLPAHHDFDLSTIEDSTIRTIAAVGLEALDSGQMRFDGSDLMPQQIGGFTSDTFEPGIFWSEMVRYFREGSPDNYRQMAQEIADNIEAAWVALEAEQAGAGA